MRKYVLLYVVVLILTGCSSIGPGRVHMDRGTYNNVVRQTEQEQMLMNIVRERYLEISQYIQIGSLTASYSLSQSLSGSVNATTSPGPSSLTSNLSPTVTYSDTPTISYMPLSSIEFAKSLMTPISMTNFLLLAHAGGYDHTMLYPLFIEQIGNISSDLLNRNGSNIMTPQYVKFSMIMHLISNIYRKGGFEIPRAVVFNKSIGGLLRFRNHLEYSPEAVKLERLLEIPIHSKDIILIDHSLLEKLEEKNGLLFLNDDKNKPHNLIYVRLRSVYSIISLLGRGVRIPCQDIKAHMTKEVINPDGSIYDWGPRMKNIMTIYSSEKEPKEDVLVKVIVHNHWFYIKSSDLTSKDTFDAVIRLFTLTSAIASANNSMPVLTIPVTAAG